MRDRVRNFGRKILEKYIYLKFGRGYQSVIYNILELGAWLALGMLSPQIPPTYYPNGLTTIDPKIGMKTTVYEVSNELVKRLFISCVAIGWNDYCFDYISRISREEVSSSEPDGQGGVKASTQLCESCRPGASLGSGPIDKKGEKDVEEISS